MRFDIDTYKEIIETLSRNKSHSFLTGFGVFQGIFTLMGLIGDGQGLRELPDQVFEGFTTNSSIISAQPTTRPCDGHRERRKWTLEYKDMECIKTNIHGLDIVTPGLSRWGGNAMFDNKKSNCNTKGLMAGYTKVEVPHMYYGRYLNGMDIQQRREVYILGEKVYKNLFPGGGGPCGQSIRINSVYYSVMGIDYSTDSIQTNGSAEENIVIPLPLMQQAYNLGQAVHVICVTGRPGIKMSKVAQPMRDTIVRAHHIDPTDEKGVTMFNTEVMYGMVGSSFASTSFLVWPTGVGTLLAGAIGVSNIMMVTVRKRTTEIGIRCTTGATPCATLGQIIAESIILIAVADMDGILFAVTILQLTEMSTATDSPTAVYLQVSFQTAVDAVIMLSLLGVLAGLAPALRAASTKPVDAV